jgi:thiamine-phosphate pyrophosphorylase
MKVIVLSNPKILPQEAEILNSLFSLGMSCLHLRKTDCSDNDIIGLLKGIHKEYHNRIMIHGHYNLIENFDLKGLHFPVRDQHLIPEFKDYPGIRSTSSHSLEEVLQLPPEIDYTFLSPIFDSISKKGYKQNFTLESLPDKKTWTGPKVIALGGISDETVGLLKNSFFEGVAVLGYIWEKKNDIDKIQAFKKIAPLL